MGSNATWKLWGNEVTLMRLRVPQLNADDPAPGRCISADAWDGYPSERNELMGFLKTNQINNVVVLSGDIHASFAGLVMDNFDAATQTPVAAELVASGISSNSLFSFFENATRAPAVAALRPLITVDASAVGGSNFTENFNLLLQAGVTSAGTFAGAIAKGAPVAMALAAAEAQGTVDTTCNPHLKYIDTNAQGYGYVKCTATEVDATIVTVNRPIMAPTDAGPGIKRTASFTIPKDNVAGMTAATFTGTKPFPLS
jgi:alkaline phosphatase D